jgi:hypothetical protein
MPDEPRDHVIRDSLPWRTDELTECGRAVSDVASIITKEQLVWRLKQYGQQRTAFTVCMTCFSAARDSARWETNPTGMLSRDMRRGRMMTYRDYDRTSNTYGVVKVDRLSAELHAIAGLIEAHREEFDERVEASKQAALFAARRRAAEKQKNVSPTSSPISPIGGDS